MKWHRKRKIRHRCAHISPPAFSRSLLIGPMTEAVSISEKIVNFNETTWRNIPRRWLFWQHILFKCHYKNVSYLWSPLLYTSLQFCIKKRTAWWKFRAVRIKVKTRVTSLYWQSLRPVTHTTEFPALTDECGCSYSLPAVFSSQLLPPPICVSVLPLASVSPLDASFLPGVFFPLLCVAVPAVFFPLPASASSPQVSVFLPPFYAVPLPTVYASSHLLPSYALSLPLSCNFKTL